MLAKIKYIICFVSLCFLSKAQITFPAAGAVWHYAILSQNVTLKYTYDSLFMGRTTHVIESPYNFIDCAAIQQPNKTLVYTSNDSVFFHNTYTKNQWELLYSFGTPVGQSWRVLLKDTVWPNIAVTDTMTFTVDSVKNTTINSLLLKTLYVTSKETTSQGATGFTDHPVIYDRIGANSHLLPFYSANGINQTDCPYPYLLCYNDSTLGLYQPDTTSCTYVPSNIIEQATNNNQIIIYPNPSTKIISLSLSNIFVYQNTLITIQNIVGQTVRKIPFTKNIDVTDLEQGCYFLLLTLPNREIYKAKFIKL